MDEFALIDAIRARLMRRREDIVTHIGDDAAVLAADERDSVLSVDVAVEGVHFRRDLLGLGDLGWRSFMAATSDLAAMGAAPRAALLSLILPASMSDEETLELVDGVAEAADAVDMAVVGGNISAGGELSITTTVLGGAGATTLSRVGARVGDGIYVTGAPGSAALGLRWLLDEKVSNDDPLAAPFVRSWRRPRARLEEGAHLVGLASAAIDISDGLLQDLCHLLRASDVGAELSAGDLPREDSFDELARRLDADPLEMILSGGEDYELLFTADGEPPSLLFATRIGQITEGEEPILRDDEGRALDLPIAGYRHR